MSSIDGVSNDGGNVALVSGRNINIKPDSANKNITISSIGGAGGGDITAVNAGTGLTDGATTGEATLNIGIGEGIATTADTVSLDTSYTHARYIFIRAKPTLSPQI